MANEKAAEKSKTEKRARVKVASRAKLLEAGVPTVEVPARGEQGSKRYSPGGTGFEFRNQAHAVLAFGSQENTLRILSDVYNRKLFKLEAPVSPAEQRKKLQANIERVENMKGISAKTRAAMVASLKSELEAIK